MKLRIFYDNLKFRLKESKRVLKIIEKVIRSENKIPGDLNFIITTDYELLRINKEFLKNEYFTDVIAFENNENKIINGEIYLSIETIKRNAHNYEVSLREEVIRVMIHGVLHLCGYRDKKSKEKKQMRILENKWIESIIKK